jgi:hypothetical protein
MILVGLILILVGLIILYFGIYRRNTLQGIVSEASPVFLVMFGLMDWKNNKFSISTIILGFTIIIASVFI